MRGQSMMTAAELRKIRATLALTQKEMAALLGAGMRSYQHWEDGDRPIPAPVILLARIRLRDHADKGDTPMLHGAEKACRMAERRRKEVELDESRTMPCRCSHRFARLATKLGEKDYRDGYVATQLSSWLAGQVRALRGDMSQAEFGKLIGKPQAAVSRLENPDYGKLSLQTLLEVAERLDIALMVRFVDYPTFLIWTDNTSEEALRPASYNQAQVDHLAQQISEQGKVRD